jgi:multicomponent Na+:H+ antiporter subunit E
MIVLIMIALSTVPGSLVVEKYHGELVVHVLGLTGDVTGTVLADVAELEERIVRAFGTVRDREELG